MIFVDSTSGAIRRCIFGCLMNFWKIKEPVQIIPMVPCTLVCSLRKRISETQVLHRPKMWIHIHSHTLTHTHTHISHSNQIIIAQNSMQELSNLCEFRNRICVEKFTFRNKLLSISKLWIIKIRNTIQF